VPSTCFAAASPNLCPSRSRIGAQAASSWAGQEEQVPVADADKCYAAAVAENLAPNRGISNEAEKGVNGTSGATSYRPCRDRGPPRCQARPRGEGGGAAAVGHGEARAAAGREGAARDGGIPAARHDWPASLGEGSSPSVRGIAATRRAQCLGVTPPRSINRS
jgi:hypothetical protein